MADVSADDLYEKLRAQVHDPAARAKHQATVEAELAAYEARRRQHDAEVVAANSLLPASVSQVRILGANNTRRSFLHSIIHPLLTPENFATDLGTLHARVLSTASSLHRLGIFRDIGASIAPTEPSDPSSSATDLAITFNVKERSRLELKTGTDVGNTEGSAYVSGIGRNLFGGAETLNVNASYGTRVRSAYAATYGQPLFANPDLRWELSGLAATAQKPWASHDEVSRAGSTKLTWLSSTGKRHDLSYGYAWRQITGLGEKASRTIRDEAGDSVKSSVNHTCTFDSRDNPAMASRGYMWRTISEIAGWGPLKGDVAFWRSELDSSASTKVWLPFMKNSYALGLTTTSSFRAGILYPMTLAGESVPRQSIVADRFQLGGPTDVRGFRIGGLGPRDGADAVGGDMYAAGSLKLLAPLPRLGPEVPLRIQAFVNAGRLVALRDLGKDVSEKGSYWGSQKSVIETLKDLGDGLPSTTFGVGLVYAGQGARVELNFSLPLIVRTGEEGRKGLQVGVGVSFL